VGSRKTRTQHVLSDIDTHDATKIDYTLFWAPCRENQEAPYLLSLINSLTLYEAAQPLLAKGPFGVRHLQTHMRQQPIPEYDATNRLHQEIARAGQAAASGAAQQLQNLNTLSTTIARRELRG